MKSERTKLSMNLLPGHLFRSMTNLLPRVPKLLLANGIVGLEPADNDKWVAVVVQQAPSHLRENDTQAYQRRKGRSLSVGRVVPRAQTMSLSTRQSAKPGRSTKRPCTLIESSARLLSLRRVRASRAGSESRRLNSSALDHTSARSSQNSSTVA